MAFASFSDYDNHQAAMAALNGYPSNDDGEAIKEVFSTLKSILPKGVDMDWGFDGEILVCRDDDFEYQQITIFWDSVSSEFDIKIGDVCIVSLDEDDVINIVRKSSIWAPSNVIV